MALRFLLVEGNTREDRARHAAAFGAMPSQSYASVLQGIEPDLVYDIAFPADAGANLPDGAGLSGYDAVVLTGSALHAYDPDPAVLRQIDLMRATYVAGVPCFGSCWGIQIATVAAGGTVHRNPKGSELGFARNIAPSEAGRGHPLLAGRPLAFDAPAVHLDAVAAPPPSATVLAANAGTPVQAAEIRHAGGVFWGIQYHPEFDLGELAVILRRMGPRLVEEGFCRSRADAEAYADDLDALHADPARFDLAWRHGLDAEVLDPVRRTAEIRNFIEHRVKRTKSERGRA